MRSWCMQVGMTMDAQDVAALDSTARQTDRLWIALSRYVAKIEADMQGSASSSQGDVAQATRVLPPEAAQVATSSLIVRNLMQRV